MKNFSHLYIVTLSMVLLSATTVAQEKEESELNGGTITVVKPYDPSISDAFKVKSMPVLKDSTELAKRPVTYTIFSVPVASTFTPAKGKLNRLKPQKRTKFYDNYARLGLGNYVNILGEFAGNFEINRDTDFGVFLNHNSSQGGIDEVVLNDSFSDTSLDLSFGKRHREMDWGITAGGRLQTANWYGVPQQVFDAGFLLDEDLDVGINYLSVGAGAQAQWYDAALKSLHANLYSTTSNNEASEIQASFSSQFVFNIVNEEISLGTQLDYLNGTFDVPNSAVQDYQYLNLGVSPSINLYGDRYKAEIGASINYLNDTQNEESQLYVYPKISASFIVVEDLLNAYTEIGGGLDMNNLRSITDENIFIEPAVTIIPTNRQIDAQLGVKGNLTDQLGYKIYGGYRIEENRYFYTANSGLSITTLPKQNHDYGNAFDLQYADLSTLTLGGQISYDWTTDLQVALDVQSLSYNVSNGDNFNNVASHLPSFMTTLIANYDMNDKWNIGASLYYVGEREVFVQGATETPTLDGFADLNIDVNYKINDKLSAFARVYNLTGGNYQFYNAYPVQNLQIMAGAVYKFDF